MAESIFKRFVQRLGGVTKPVEPGDVHVGLFGKHPAWDDHIPDVGMDHPRLLELKKVLYEGIGANIDLGSWQKLPDGNSAEPFGHTFMGDGREVIAGRIWQSRDGKGREHYPMIAAVVAEGLSLDWAVASAAPLLQALQQECVRAATAQEVTAALAASRQKLRDSTSATAPADAALATPDLSDSVALLCKCPEFGPNQEGLFRVLYHIEREFSAGSLSAGKARDLAGFAVRVPCCVEPVVRSAALWLQVAAAWIDSPVPLLALAPDHDRWLDLLIAPPAASQLFCLRAPAQVLPFTSDIPYEIDPPFKARSQAWIDKCIQRQ